MINRSAIYHRGNEVYRFVLKNRDVQIKLQTGKEVTKVEIKYGDYYENYSDSKGVIWESDIIEMSLWGETEDHLIWTCIVKPPYHRLKYYFIINDDEEMLCYGELGFNSIDKIDFWNKFCLPYVHKEDHFDAPEWAQSTIWYQIFPERFFNGNKNNDPQETLPWNSILPKRDSYFGGDIAGITSKLDYLKDLGINGIYLNPIFKATSNHKYDTIDYLEIDPAFGTLEEVKIFVNEAHKRDIKIMFDAVFNHTGTNFPMWEDILKNRDNSIYKDWYNINNLDTMDYETFSYCESMPKLNTHNPDVINYLINIATYWIKEVDIDGWRLDVANEVDFEFWRKFRTSVRAIKSDLYIVGEVWHDANPWLRGDQYDSVMNYTFARAFTDYVKGNLSSKEFRYRMDRNLNLYPDTVTAVSFCLLDSHDTVRLRNQCNNNIDKMKIALTFLLTSPGSPSVYYGTEIALEGEGDPDCRRCMIWDNLNEEQIAFKTFLKNLIKVRKDNPCLRGLSEWNWLIVEDNYLCYERKIDNESLYIIVNNLEDEVKIKLPDNLKNNHLTNIFDGTIVNMETVLKPLSSLIISKK